MLASEVIYQTLAPLFNGQVAPAPLVQGQQVSGTYLTYQSISEESLETVNGWTGHDHVRMQVNIFNHDSIECERDKNRVKFVMRDQKLTACAIAGGHYAGFDEATQLHHHIVEFFIWQNAN